MESLLCQLDSDSFSHLNLHEETDILSSLSQSGMIIPYTLSSKSITLELTLDYICVKTEILSILTGQQETENNTIMAFSAHLDIYFDQYASEPDKKIRGGEPMHHEVLRLSTFIDYPSTESGWPSALARAGFYYDGRAHEIRCFSCKGTVKQWRSGDDPFDEHSKKFEHCLFILRQDSMNIAFDPPEDGAPREPTQRIQSQNTQSFEAETALQQATQLGIITDIPRHPDYALKVHRLQTYRDFPRSSPVNPDVLAEAGFFFTGNGDCVRCFYCDMGLRHWEPGDDPWEEHARWYPRCNYMITTKGEEYIRQIQDKYNQTSAGTSSQSAQVTANSGENVTATPGSESSWIECQLNSSVVKTILEMGYPRAQVRRALEIRHARYGLEFITIQNLLEAIFEIEESGDNDWQAATVTPTAATATPVTLAEVRRTTTVAPGSTATSAAATTSTSTSAAAAAAAAAIARENHGEHSQQSEDQSVVEENRQLKEERVCKVCMDKDVNIVFLPCGHLCCCSNCAPALRKCPICRQLVRGTVRIFLS